MKHGPSGGYYSLGDGKRCYALIVCLCGWSGSGSALNWEEAGIEFDRHLEEAKQEKIDAANNWRVNFWSPQPE